MENEELYNDVQTFGLIEDMRDQAMNNSFRIAWNLRLVFGQGIIERADLHPFGPSRTIISADEALEVLYEHRCLPVFVSTCDTRD